MESSSGVPELRKSEKKLLTIVFVFLGETSSILLLRLLYSSLYSFIRPEALFERDSLALVTPSSSSFFPFYSSPSSYSARP